MSEPDIARDAGPLSTAEALAILDVHMARAMKSGSYGLHADLCAISELIETQAETIDELRSAGGNLIWRMLTGIEPRKQS